MKHELPASLQVLLLSLLFACGSVLAQPGPPFGGMPGEPGPPPFAGPPENPGPPPGIAPGDGEDEEDGDENGDENGEDNSGPPDFCSADGLPRGDGPDGQAGLSSIAHLDFSLRDLEDEPLDEGAWGRMTYRWIAPIFDYIFNGHELPIGGEYTLTYQPQPLPSPGVICLGAGTVNDEGDLHLENAFDLDTDLPTEADANEDGAVIALVVSADVDCDLGDMINWTPENYLFGDEGMFYVDSDL